ncbi:MAG TPA: hypothetical protein VM118_04480 [Acidobacteriota bacterium]|nr:hypothetical protein [Acidobacteriota bacterium]
MSLAFACKECGQPVVTGYMKVGEEMPCPHCGHNIHVPETATQTDKRPTVRTAGSATRKSILAEGSKKPGAVYQMLGVVGILVGVIVMVAALNASGGFGGEQIAVTGSAIGLLYALVGAVAIGVGTAINRLESLRGALDHSQSVVHHDR